MYWLIAYVVLSYVIVLSLIYWSEQKDRQDAKYKGWDDEDRVAAGGYLLAAPVAWWLLTILYVDLYYGKQISVWWADRKHPRNPLFYIGCVIERICT